MYRRVINRKSWAVAIYHYAQTHGGGGGGGGGSVHRFQGVSTPLSAQLRSSLVVIERVIDWSPNCVCAAVSSVVEGRSLIESLMIALLASQTPTSAAVCSIYMHIWISACTTLECKPDCRTIIARNQRTFDACACIKTFTCGTSFYGNHK